MKGSRAMENYNTYNAESANNQIKQAGVQAEPSSNAISDGEAGLYAKLAKVQQEVSVPKANSNDFGKYKYRSAEDIIQTAKPVLDKYSLVLILKDEIERIGDCQMAYPDGRRILKPNCYVKATAILIDTQTKAYITTTAYAHECEHKGMSADQCTGTASSYARKYALNALFLIADVKENKGADNNSCNNYNRQNGNYNNGGNYKNGNYNNNYNNGWNRY